MLLHHLPHLAERKIVLASASPRRKELLSKLGVKFDIIVSDFDETLPKGRFQQAYQYAVETARQKAMDVAAKGLGDSVRPDMVIGADTIVEYQGQILEKPADAADAFRVLSMLSGGRHQVHTGVALVLPMVPDPESGAAPYVRTFACTTDVFFDDLHKELIEAYIASGEPFGKAGSYGIQGLAGSFVKRIEGCYFNVMGFPVHRFSAEMVALLQEGYLPCPVLMHNGK